MRPITFQHFVFRSMENLEKFIQDIQKKDSSGIHQYAIPIRHGFYFSQI